MTNAPMMRVIEPGMLTSVQDNGRPGFADIGAVAGGAADKLSYRVGNRLLGNESFAAALEMTLVGGTFEFTHDTAVVVTGGATTMTIEGDSTLEFAAWTPSTICAGEQLRVGPLQAGARAYLCVAGGIHVPDVMYSRSTHLTAGFGGYQGRSLRAGDELPIGSATKEHSRSNATKASQWLDDERIERIRSHCVSVLARRALRVVDGPHQASFKQAYLDAFWKRKFQISNQSNRAGLRLEPQPVDTSEEEDRDSLGRSASAGKMPSEGMMQGAVQVPEDGQPIVLMVDHPTTGGYPVIATVASVDHPVLGQLRPREQVSFERISRDEARQLYQDLQAEIERALSSV